MADSSSSPNKASKVVFENGESEFFFGIGEVSEKASATVAEIGEEDAVIRCLEAEEEGEKEEEG